MAAKRGKRGRASSAVAAGDREAHAAERRDRALLLAILGAAFLLATAFPVSLRMMDELEYVRTAQAYARGSLPPEDSFRSRRLGLLFPMAAVFRIFGDAEPAYRFVPMLAYLGNIGIAYHLARRAIGGRAGILGALLAAIHPTAYWQSTVPNTDMVFAFWSNLAIASLIAARDREDPRGAFRGGLAAGFFLGAAYLTKAMAILAAPLVLLLVLPRPRRIPILAGIAVALAAVVAAECAISAALWGAPFGRWEMLARVSAPDEPLAERLASYPRLLFDPLDFRNAWVGLHPLLGFAAALWAVLRRDPRTRPFALWMIVCTIAVAYGTTSVRAWSPILGTDPRFLAWAAMPGHVLGAWAIARGLARAKGGRRIAVAGAVALALHSILLCAILRRDTARDFAALRLAIRWLGDRPLPAAVYTDWASALALSAFLGLEPGFEIIDYQTVGEWRGRRGIIIDNETLRGHPTVAGKQLDAASTGARLIERFETAPPRRLRAWLGIGPDARAGPSISSIWELPDGWGSAPRR